MHIRRLLSLGTALFLVLSGPTFAEDAHNTESARVDQHSVLAKVNDYEITVAHVVAAKSSLPEQFQALPADVLLPGLVEQLIQQAVLSQAIGEVSHRTQVLLENHRSQIIAAEMVDSVIDGVVTDKALQDAYDAEYSNVEPVTEHNASHILVETKERAEALITELQNGKDFAELAIEASVGPSGPNGGSLGWFGPGMMVKPFEDAVLALEVGHISAPVETQFGWHIVKLNEKRQTGAPELAEVREQLIGKIQNDAVEAALQKLLAAAKIERQPLDDINPEILSENQ